MSAPHGYVEYPDGKGRPRTCEEAEAAREADRRDAERYREIVRRSRGIIEDLGLAFIDPESRP